MLGPRVDSEVETGYSGLHCANSMSVGSVGTPKVKWVGGWHHLITCLHLGRMLVKSVEEMTITRKEY